MHRGAVVNIHIGAAGRRLGGLLFLSLLLLFFLATGTPIYDGCAAAAAVALPLHIPFPFGRVYHIIRYIRIIFYHAWFSFLIFYECTHTIHRYVYIDFFFYLLIFLTF